MEAFKKHAKWFMFHISEDRLDSTSAHAAYFLIISFIPFVAFLVALFNQLNLSETQLFSEFISLIPPSIVEAVSPYLAENLYISSVFSISIITFIWSSSSGMVAIIKGFDKIYEVEETRNYIVLRIIAIVYILAFALVLILTAVTLVFGSSVYDFLYSHAGPVIATILQEFKSAFGFIVLVVFFCFIYNAIPRKRVKFINNLFGAIFSSAGWVLFSYFFSIFVDNSTNFSVIYGSLATLVILMFWLFFCMYIMFLGAEVSMWLQYSTIKDDIKSIFKKQRKPKTLSTASENRDNKTPEKINKSEDKNGKADN